LAIENNLLRPVSSSLFIGLCVLVDSGPLASIVANVRLKPLTLQISPGDVRQLLTISSGFQKIAQQQQSFSEPIVTTTEAPPIRTASTITEAQDEVVPSDLALKLAGKLADVDVFANINLESIAVAVSVDCREILTAAVEGVNLKLVRRTFDTDITFGIRDMNVQECLSNTKLIHSHLALMMQSTEASVSRNFVNVHYVQQDRTSPAFKEVDHYVEVSVGLVEMNLEPTSLFETTLFIVRFL
jgi:hypothetical protein